MVRVRAAHIPERQEHFVLHVRAPPRERTFVTRVHTVQSPDEARLQWVWALGQQTPKPYIPPAKRTRPGSHPDCG